MKIITPQQMPETIGYSSEPTSWFTVTQDQINSFADCTHDHQFIHCDPEKAAATPFGTTIAHGFLTLSMIAHFAKEFSVLIEGTTMGVNYGFDKVRFLSPVKVGSRIRAITSVKDITEKKTGQVLIKYDVSIEIENDPNPALVAEWLGMVYYS
jgi:acyl dehydratase